MPAPLAWRIASAEGLYDALDVAEVAENVQRSVAEVAEVHAEVADRFGIARLRQQIETLPADSHWQSLAKGALADDLGGLQRRITQAVMATGEGEPTTLLAAWEAGNASALGRARRLLADLGDSKSADLAMLSVALRELRNLA